LKAFGREGSFLRPAISAFGPDQVKEFLEECGVFVTQEGVQTFIAGGGPRLIDGLSAFLRKKGVKVLYDQRVVEVRPMDEGKFDVLTEKDRFLCLRKVILTAGGKSFPRWGTTGDGLTIAKGLGHDVTMPVPAMGPIRVRETIFTGLAGISLPEVEVEVMVDDKREGKFRGGFLVTHHGISGPVILDASLVAARGIQKNKAVSLKVHFLPGTGGNELEAFEKMPSRFRDALRQAAGIETKVLSQITRAQRHELVQMLTAMKLTVEGMGSWDESMVMVGGVSLKQVDPRTMESKVVKGVYFAGEILDLAGRCGGYNIQAALSTGYLAGMS
jgi:predicted Rossmann fold flavoprotein